MNIPSLSFALLSFSVLCLQVSSILQDRIYKKEIRNIKDKLNLLELRYYLLQSFSKIKNLDK